MNKTLKVFTIIFLYLAQESHSHGRFIKPVSRSSIWRDPNFARYYPPKNYDDNQLFCGGIHQVDNPGSHCGVCGDRLSSSIPRPNEIGGKWYRGIITGNYKSGQEIDVAAEITAQHKGFMEWRLCTDHQQENQQCFDQYLLRRADGFGSRLLVSDIGWYTINLTLPEGVRCNHCVIQWNYRAENNWGRCKNGRWALGCGPQETFRGCSDVRIT